MGTKKADATRKKLLDAALEVMAQQGYAGATMGQIAAAAGVSKGLAYYHFASKADIASEILGSFVSEVYGQFVAIAGRAPSGLGALVEMLDLFADTLAENGRLSSFYLSELWRKTRVWALDMGDLEAKLIALVAEQFARAKREGKVREEVDPEFAAVTSIGIVLTTAMRYFGADEKAGPRLAKDEYVRSVVDFILHAVDTRA